MRGEAGEAAAAATVAGEAEEAAAEEEGVRRALLAAEAAVPPPALPPVPWLLRVVAAGVRRAAVLDCVMSGVGCGGCGLGKGWGVGVSDRLSQYVHGLAVGIIRIWAVNGRLERLVDQDTAHAQ